MNVDEVWSALRGEAERVAAFEEPLAETPVNGRTRR